MVLQVERADSSHRDPVHSRAARPPEASEEGTDFILRRGGCRTACQGLQSSAELCGRGDGVGFAPVGQMAQVSVSVGR